MSDRPASPSTRVQARLLSVALVLLLLAALVPTGVASATPANRCDKQNNDTYTELLECLTVDGAFEHLEALQAIADANEDPSYPGTRAAGTEGYQGSVDYIAELLDDAGWNITLDPVETTFVFPAILRQLTPVDAEYETGVFLGSGDGEVEGNVVPVDIDLTEDGRVTNTSGCEAGDFDGIDLSGPSDIVLLQRGACNFADKAGNAEGAGAEAVIIFNTGTAGSEDLIVGDASTLADGTPIAHGIPVVGASFADGVELATPGSTALMKVLPSETRTDHNVIAELPGRNLDNVVMAGAHLDSVIAGPGLNDNVSGSVALLELGLLLSKGTPDNTLRFAWWTAEEQGLVGSTSYVANLDEQELDRIAAYLNFDMIASPNFVYGVYDADESSFEAPVPVPEGSEALEDLFEVYFTWQDIPYEDSEFSGRSDYQAFIINDIPASGLFTGAEMPKTPAQETIWGGVAEAPYDPCYHLGCDSLESDADADRPAAVYDVLHQDYDLAGNVNLDAFGTNMDAIAFAVLTLAYSTEDVNGVPGKQVPDSASLKLPAPGGPEGTAGLPGGGHTHDHHATS